MEDGKRHTENEWAKYHDIINDNYYNVSARYILGKVSPLVYFLFADTKYRQHRQDLYVRVNID